MTAAVQETLDVQVERVVPWLEELANMLDAGESLHSIATRLGKRTDSIRRDLGPDRANRPDLLARMSAARVPVARVPGPRGAAPGMPAQSMPRLDAEDMACVGEDPDLWFGEHPSDVLAAVKVCERCPVRLRCYDGARARGERWGVWGGVSFPVKARGAE